MKIEIEIEIKKGVQGEKTNPKTEPKQEPVNCQRIVDQYNAICKDMPKVQVISQQRRDATQARAREHGRNRFSRHFTWQPGVTFSMAGRLRQ